ncbi:MAG: M20/M25/M40 family metallo-hydrolase [Deltaproteobacteria bacterium]|jgi:carboxypeptidase PM20D1|nr:M20/M25/M40 family metallo-hydrolase [Deltaproteobacteria bacterium]MBT6432476.1 M20/M25/M40 family metallo-hydrolase [Deltaproteobacteria bacterium]
MSLRINTALLVLLSASLTQAAQNPEVNVEQSATHLSQAIKFETVSTMQGPLDPKAFTAFHQYLEQTYPLVHQAMSRSVVADYSLLYRWPGKDLSRPPAMFLAHQDVVPVDEATLRDWKHPPFSGVISENSIWGRGTMDFKFGLIALFEAAEHLLQQGFVPEQTLYFGFSHDEEVLGKGAPAMVKALQDQGIKLDWLLDEGLVITHQMFPGLDKPLALVGLAEKGFLSVEIEAAHPGGHSSMPPAQTAAGIIARAVVALEDNPMPQRLTGPVEMMIHRVGEYMPWYKKAVFQNLAITGSLVLGKLGQKSNTNALTRTTTAVTMLKGSPQDNVLPNRAKAVINFRILPGDTVESVLVHVKETIADERVSVKPYSESRGENPSPTSCADCKAFTRIEDSIKKIYPDAMVAPSILVGATDSRHFSTLSDKIYRFSPQEIWPEDMSGFHGINEKTGVEAFGRAVAFYMAMMSPAL